jgi:adenosylcobinamide-GDP ribazoletransferase
MKPLLTAFRFLTVIPLGRGDDPGPKGMAAAMMWFPVVGFALGLVLVCINWAFDRTLPQQVLDAVLITTLVVMTGALHLDGFADTLDGISGGRGDKARMLAIMKDSHIGAVGVVGLVLLLLMKYAALESLPWHIRAGTLILMPVAGRWTQVLMAFGSDYARKEGSLAQPFVEHLELGHFLFATFTAALAAFLFVGLKALMVTGAVGVIALGAKYYFARRLGGVTGDTIGAVSETCEVLVLIGMVFAG